MDDGLGLVVHDCIIIGAGPAGLSAAIYMGRFLRDVVVVDHGQGRSTFGQTNDNYLGFPNGVPVRELRALGHQQAERFGVKFVDGEVTAIQRCHTLSGPTESQRSALGQEEPVAKVEEEFTTSDRDFIVRTSSKTLYGRTIILCTGVCDIWPDIPRLEEHVGKSLFWCITCDGFRAANKKVVLYGCTEDAAATACQFNLYTKDITLVVPPGGLKCSDERELVLEENKIQRVEGEPDHIEGHPGEMKALLLKDGTRIEADLMFSLLGVTPNNTLAIALGVACNEEGFVKVDTEGYTSVPGVFCAGDLSGIHTHQIVSAAHEGAEAAQTANYYLYADYQKVVIESSEEQPGGSQAV